MTAHSSLRLCVSRSKLTCYRASVSIDATINTVYRFLAVLFLGLASVSFAQVAPIAKPGAPAPSVSEENDDEDEATPSTVRTPAVVAQPGKTPAPPVTNQPARPAPSVPRVVSTPPRPPQTPAPGARANPQPGVPQ